MYLFYTCPCSWLFGFCVDKDQGLAPTNTIHCIMDDLKCFPLNDVVFWCLQLDLLIK